MALCLGWGSLITLTYEQTIVVPGAVKYSNNRVELAYPTLTYNVYRVKV